MGELSSKMLSQQKPTAALLGQGLGLLLSWPFIPPLNQQLVSETWSPRAGLCLGKRNWIFLRAYWMESKNWVLTTEPPGSRPQVQWSSSLPSPPAPTAKIGAQKIVLCLKRLGNTSCENTRHIGPYVSSL